MKYEAIIGLEVHAQLATRSKLFCGCDASAFDAEPNAHTCPVCSGMPGALPVINQLAVEYTIRAGLALNCQIAEFTRWDRKSYHYPDLPKGYQISQYDLPLARDGWLMIEVDGHQKRIGIRRAHLEEDAGKSFHLGDHSLIDLNRAGVPLLEIVTEPDLRSADEAYAYLTRLRTILRYLGISSADMEKGAMRCEPNVSLRPVGASEYGRQTEIKNLNSFRAVRLAIAYEIDRQTRALESGARLERLTMGWDEQRGVTVPQRTKEMADDYRYFPEPDLPPLRVSEEWVERIRAELPELPDARKARFMSEYGLPAYNVSVLVADRAIADYFEAAAQAYCGDPRIVSNWVSGELFRLMKEASVEVRALRVTPTGLAELLSLVDRGIVNAKTAKDVLSEMFQSGQIAGEIVQRRGLAQVSDQATLQDAVAQVIAANQKQVQQYLAGKETVAQWLMGQVMRATGGQANPHVVLALLTEQLEAMKGQK